MVIDLIDRKATANPVCRGGEVHIDRITNSIHSNVFTMGAYQ